MSNYIAKMQNPSLANVSALSAISYLAYYDYSANSCEAKASAKLFHSAALLPEGEFLGLQFGAGQDKRCSCLAFSSAKAEVATEDFNWIFRNCAIVNSGSAEMLKDFDLERHKAYILRFLPEDCRNADRATSRTYEINISQRDYSDELLETMIDTGAAIRVLAVSGCGCEQGYGAVLIALPSAISLRMRTLLSLVFPRTTVAELTDYMLSQGSMPKLPAAYATDAMARLLQVFMYKMKKEPEHTQMCDDDELTPECIESCEDDELTSGRIGIDELDLSVRAYNCLRRAGISTVGELRAMSDEDLLHVRNLGRKGAADVKDKLDMFFSRGNMPAPLAASDSSATLDELIGLKEIKEQVRKIAAFAMMKRDMAEQKKEAASMALNMAFVGNPGTAKTTVARILAGMFHEAGLLADSELVEVGRADLVAKYVGQTADKVKSVFGEAEGKLLFIDEAYSLADLWEGGYGDEAITTIVQEMENRRDDTIVIFAGYPDKMEEFIARNPGLRSRIPFTISFNDYSADEMVQIAELEARRKGFAIHPQAMEKVTAICKAAAARPDSGNGRFCRNLVENAILNYAARAYGSGADAGNRDFVLTGEDFTISEALPQAKKAGAIGFRA